MALTFAKKTLFLAGRAFFGGRARRAARDGYFAGRDLERMAAGKIALVACHWLGDTFWAAQVIPALKRRFAGAEFHVFAKSFTRDLFNGLVPEEKTYAADAVVSDRRRERVSFARIARTAGEYAAHEFDLAIDLTGNRYSAYFTYRLRPAFGFGFDGGELGWLYSRCAPDAERADEHLSYRPFRVVAPFFDAAPARPEFLTPPEPTVSDDEIWRELGAAEEKVCVIAPGAGWKEKEWAPENFAALGKALSGKGFRVILTGSEGQRELCRDLAGAIGKAAVFVGRPIGHVAALVKVADAVVANDSFVGHIGAAFGVRTAVVFTRATDPEKCGPIGRKDRLRVFSAPVTTGEIEAYLTE